MSRVRNDNSLFWCVSKQLIYEECSMANGNKGAAMGKAAGGMGIGTTVGLA